MEIGLNCQRSRKEERRGYSARDMRDLFISWAAQEGGGGGLFFAQTCFYKKQKNKRKKKEEKNSAINPFIA